MNDDFVSETQTIKEEMLEEDKASEKKNIYLILYKQ